MRFKFILCLKILLIHCHIGQRHSCCLLGVLHLKTKLYSLTVYRNRIFEFLSFVSNIYEIVTPPHSARSQNTIIPCINTVETLNLATLIWIG